MKTEFKSNTYGGGAAGPAATRRRAEDSPIPFVQDVHILVAVQQKMH
jgi:hypothetical protein